MPCICHPSHFIDLKRNLEGLLAATSLFAYVVGEVLDVALVEELESITFLHVEEFQFIEATLASCLCVDVAFQYASLFISCDFLLVKEQSAMDFWIARNQAITVLEQSERFTC